MRFFFILFASLMLVTTAWSGAAQALDICCGDSTTSMAIRAADYCDRAPANTQKGYPRCHAGCHVQSVTTAAPEMAAVSAVVAGSVYVVPDQIAVAAHDADLTLRPPIA